MVLHMLRMETACFIILVFLAVVFFSAKREKTNLHKLFSLVIISLMTHLVFDGITVYTVNNLDTVPNLVNDICHKIYLVTMLLTLNLICQYICCLIHEEVNKRELSKSALFVRLVMNAYTAVAMILIIVSPMTYVTTDQGNYSASMGMTIIFVSIVIYTAYMLINIMFNIKQIHPRKKIAIGTAIIITIIVSILTALRPTLLLAGFGFTLMVVAFYITLENPDIRLVEEVKEEKKKAEDANASKSKFISIVSHEMRTPMNAVVGMTGLLLKDNPTESQEKYLKNIQSSGKAMVQILNDVLDMSKLEAGKLEVICEPYNIYDVLNDVRMIIENRIGSKPIELIYDIDERISENLDGDALRIRQIFINLLNNAVKFTEKGEIRLSMEYISSNDIDYTIRFAVKDTGQGIKEEDLGKLFKAFSQVDTKKNHKKEGTGMGLSISSDLIAIMGGQLEVASVYGEWTEFFFTITQGIVENPQQNKNEKEDKDMFESISGIRVLVVDDTEINLEIAKDIFEMFGVDADTAESGAAALELLKNTQYAAVFTDYFMPEMDGTQLAVEIRKLDGEYYKELPIIALTGDTTEESQQKFAEAGINDFIEKPIDPMKLAKITEKWTNKAKV